MVRLSGRLSLAALTTLLVIQSCNSSRAGKSQWAVETALHNATQRSVGHSTQREVLVPWVVAAIARVLSSNLQLHLPDALYELTTLITGSQNAEVLTSADRVLRLDAAGEHQDVAEGQICMVITMKGRDLVALIPEPGSNGQHMTVPSTLFNPGGPPDLQRITRWCEMNGRPFSSQIPMDIVSWELLPAKPASLTVENFGTFSATCNAIVSTAEPFNNAVVWVSLGDMEDALCAPPESGNYPVLRTLGGVYYLPRYGSPAHMALLDMVDCNA